MSNFTSLKYTSLCYFLRLSPIRFLRIVHLTPFKTMAQISLPRLGFYMPLIFLGGGAGGLYTC